ncbi:MAG: hypothetical protein EA381_07685 [Planctomycetaceae bacterium]|nr:MAG: hypothetical protein EA381_07685 [Planctomycetaceae bacterium]
MKYEVVLSLEAVEDVLRITITSQAKAEVVKAAKQIQEALCDDPAGAGEHLSEGLYFIDREPLRGFYTIDKDEMTVEIVQVKLV